MTGPVPVVETGIDTPLTYPSPSVRGNPTWENARVQGRSVGAGLGARDQVPRLPTPGAQPPKQL
jgi:hypothetical protein